MTLLTDEARTMPSTRPDEVAKEHSYLCRCEVCKRPAAKKWKRIKMRVEDQKRLES